VLLFSTYLNLIGPDPVVFVQNENRFKMLYLIRFKLHNVLMFGNHSQHKCVRDPAHTSGLCASRGSRLGVPGLQDRPEDLPRDQAHAGASLHPLWGKLIDYLLQCFGSGSELDLDPHGFE